MIAQADSNEIWRKLRDLLQVFGVRNLDVVRSWVPLDQSEEYVGAFLARSKIKWRWFFIIGPLAALTMKWTIGILFVVGLVAVYSFADTRTSIGA